MRHVRATLYDMTSCAVCLDAAACVDAVLPETWRQVIHTETNLWPLGVIAGRVHEDDHARYVPFSRASGEYLADVLVDNGATRETAERLVAAAWWALHLSRRDTLPHAVLALAREAAAYDAGFRAGTLHPALAR